MRKLKLFSFVVTFFLILCGIRCMLNYRAYVGIGLPRGLAVIDTDTHAILSSINLQQVLVLSM